MIILLARHGETTGNRDGYIIGQGDYPLTERGIETTTRLASLVAGMGEGIIFASPLGRARASAGIYHEKTGWEIISLDGLKELSSGEWEGEMRSVVIPDRPSVRRAWDEPPPGGESYAQGEKRVRAVIEEIRSFRDYDVILVVGHAGINRVFIKVWLEAGPGEVVETRQPHEAVYVLRETRQVSWFCYDGRTGEGLSVIE